MKKNRLKLRNGLGVRTSTHPPSPKPVALATGPNGRISKKHLRIQIFAREYLIDFNGKRAAEAAGLKQPAMASSRLLTDPACVAEIERLMQERAKRCDIKADTVLEELIQIGFSDIGKYMTWDNTGVTLYDLKNLPDGASRCIAMVSEKTTTTKRGETRRLSVKLYDKTKALEMIGRHLGMFLDKLKVEGFELKKDPKDMTTEEIVTNLRHLKLIQGGKS